ncbi:ATP-dependent DNA helicase PIF1 [Entomortierella parvispora]|uniref:ATP-dependent DNA helicase n=1 Tax=Entomortierella parvispora TaxID=205924 RepID=A0A9P3H1N6_9FUNG|nr:ATP-dependent DNA helicase PIF1 [Entomortierella parvispora]
MPERRFVGSRNWILDNTWIVPHNLWLATKYNAHINVEVCSSVVAVKYLFKYVYKGHDKTTMNVHEAVARRRAAAAAAAAAIAARDQAQAQAQEQPPQEQPPQEQPPQEQPPREQPPQEQPQVQDPNAANDPAVPDAAPRRAGKTVNEPDDYLDSRYVSACEALWRIFKFKLHGRSPAVIRLQVHLEEEQTVTYNDEDDLQHVVDVAKDSALMAWMKLNEADPEARAFTYPEIPLHYVWRRRRWIKRRYKRKVITRMYFVHPKDKERFCLRLLLLTAKGATSFEELRTTPHRDNPDRQVVHETFKQAALALGLLESDNEWYDLLREAAHDRLPGELRRLFAWVLTQCNPSDPLMLWQEFADDLALDYLRGICRRRETREREQHDPYAAVQPTPLNQDQVDAQERQDKVDSRNAALADLHRILIEMSVGHGLGEFGELYAQFTGDDLEQIIGLYEAEAPEQEHEPQEPLPLNQGQRQAFDTIIQAVQRQDVQGNLFFVDVPGGTGKSFLYNRLIAHFLDHQQDVIPVASAGIAALVLTGGRTAHSTFNIPINIHDESTCHIPYGCALAERIRNASLIIWDEAPMSHKNIFRAVDKGQIENGSLRFASLWPDVQVLRLTENMRAGQNPENADFCQFLLRVGEGREPSILQDPPRSTIRILDRFIFRPIAPDDPNLTLHAEKQFIRTLYPGMAGRLSTAQGLQAPEILEFFAQRALLTPLNANVDLLNSLATEMIPGDAIIYNARDCIPKDESPDAGQYPPEFLNSMNPSGLPPFKLELKVGQPIILLRNINPAKVLCNGTRLIVLRLGQRFIDAKVMHGVNKGHRILIPRTPITNSENDLSFPILFRRTQFPVKPAFTMSINKAQGQTLDRVGLYLPQPVFGHGQLYVALSRCTSPQNMKVLIENGSQEGHEGTYTHNIVYKRLLLDQHV